MQKFTNSVLGRLGYRIVRVHSPNKTHSHNTYQEIHQVESILKNFACNQATASKLSDYSRLRAYLSDKRIGFFIELLNVIQNSGLSWSQRSVADVGCGTGFLLRLLAESGQPSRLIGYDTNQEMNTLARAMCPDAEVVDGDIHSLCEYYDVLFCTEVLEHLIDPGAALHTLMQHTPVGGSLVLTVPDGRLNQEPAGEKRADDSAYWGHIHFWSPESWKLFLEHTAAQLGENHFAITTGTLSSTENYAVLTHIRG